MRNSRVTRSPTFGGLDAKLEPVPRERPIHRVSSIFVSDARMGIYAKICSLRCMPTEPYGERTVAINKILAPVDFSPASRKALEQAIEIASGLGAKLEITNAIEVLTYRGIPYKEVMSEVSHEEEAAEAKLKLDEWVDIAKAAGVEASGVVIKGDARSEIIRHAEAIGADLIVIGAKGHSRFHNILLGSVATHTVQSAHCSVHLVR